MVHGTSLLNTISYGSRVKWSNPGEAFGLPSTTVANFTFIFIEEWKILFAHSYMILGRGCQEKYGMILKTFFSLISLIFKNNMINLNF